MHSTKHTSCRIYRIYRCWIVQHNTRGVHIYFVTRFDCATAL